MEMLQKATLIYRLYKQSLMFISIILLCVFAYGIYISRNGEQFMLFLVIFARIFVFLPIMYFFYERKKREFLYYRNLGVTKWEILSYIYILDMVLSIFILTLSYVIFR